MSRPRESYWILEGRTPVRVEDMLAQVVWLTAGGEEQRRVGLDEISGIEISTVFLGVEHGDGDGIRPNLFETMISGRSAEHGSWRRFHRYTNWDDAQRSHGTIVAFVKRMIESGDKINPDALGQMSLLEAFVRALGG
jgi:hypothetical protein